MVKNSKRFTEKWRRTRIGRPDALTTLTLVARTMLAEVQSPRRRSRVQIFWFTKGWSEEAFMKIVVIKLEWKVERIGASFFMLYWVVQPKNGGWRNLAWVTRWLLLIKVCRLHLLLEYYKGFWHIWPV